LQFKKGLFLSQSKRKHLPRGYKCREEVKQITRWKNDEIEQTRTKIKHIDEAKQERERLDVNNNSENIV
jgi:uncharacterized protein YacL (UPF0231 family)